MTMDFGSERFQFVIGTALVLAILALAGGYLGWVHPIGDSLAVGRGFAAAGLLFVAVLASFAGLRIAAFGSMLLALLAGGQVALAYYWPGPPGELVLYQKNMLYRNPSLAELEADIRATEPMIVTLQEVSEPNQTMLANLKDVLPHQQHCPWGSVGGAAVLTRLEPIPGTSFCAPGMAVMQVAVGEKRVWLVSLHLHWPWPYDQADQVDLLLPLLAKLEGPVVLGGDFNMVRWGSTVKQIAAVIRAQPAGPTIGTYTGFAPWLNLPIDHVLAPGGGRLVTRGALGSDHIGLLAGLVL
jgi:endonuclease/exonuclease/phosphatase (EEP) superfamily protein YafD